MNKRVFVSGSYTVTKGSIDFMLNGKNVNEFVFAGSTRVSIKNNNDGTVNSVVFKGKSAGFKTSIPVLGKITIEDGATWESILPNKSYSIHGYIINNSDGTHSWYDKYTVGNYAGESASINNAGVQQHDVAPKIVNDRTMLPARFVAENLGAKVSWDEEKQLVTITGKQLKTDEDITILIYIASDNAYVNGKEIKLDSPAFIDNDRTYTPVRFVAEELGADVEWVESELKVVITSAKK